VRRLDPTRPVSRKDQLRRFLNASYALYWQAERVRKQGISWRNFCVGCSVWAFRKDASTYEDRWRVFYGMNTKVKEDSRNICAEPVPMGASLASGYTEIIGMVVVGNPQADEQGHTPKTLRPCVHCRLLMKHHPLIRPHTIIITAHPPIGEPESFDEITHEMHTFKELLQEYGET
jgi:cytidine deaminase